MTDDTRARELLAEEYNALNMNNAADLVRQGACCSPSWPERYAALRAITQALAFSQGVGVERGALERAVETLASSRHLLGKYAPDHHWLPEHDARIAELKVVLASAPAHPEQDRLALPVQTCPEGHKFWGEDAANCPYCTLRAIESAAQPLDEDEVEQGARAAATVCGLVYGEMQERCTRVTDNEASTKNYWRVIARAILASRPSTQGRKVREALERLASSETMTMPFAIDDTLTGRELRARISFARAALSTPLDPPEETKGEIITFLHLCADEANKQRLNMLAGGHKIIAARCKAESEAYANAAVMIERGDVRNLIHSSQGGGDGA